MYKAFLINSRQKSTCSNGRNSDTSLNDNGRDRGPLRDRGIGTFSIFYSSLFLHFKIQEILKQSLATLSLQKELTILFLVLHYSLSPNLILQLSIFRHTHTNISGMNQVKKKNQKNFNSHLYPRKLNSSVQFYLWNLLQLSILPPLI